MARGEIMQLNIADLCIVRSDRLRLYGGDHHGTNCQPKKKAHHAANYAASHKYPKPIFTVPGSTGRSAGDDGTKSSTD